MVTGRGGLGRGLGALIPASGAGVSEIPVGQIRPNPRQPRHRIDPGELAQLADSIREHGVLQPVVVTRAEDGVGYLLIAGERRWAAAVQAGLERIPAVIKEASPQAMLELALVENLQRADLNPLEEAGAYAQLMTEFGLTQEQVAHRVGRSRSSVANSVRLLGLPPAVQTALAAGEISEGHARALLGAETAEAMVGLFSEVVARQLSVRQTEELVRRFREGRIEVGPRAEAPVDPEAELLAERLREALGTRVELVRRGTGGRLVIHFYTQEQLDSIYLALTGGADCST